jgi:hypothetical protein
MDTFYTRQSFLLLFIFLQCDWLLGDRKKRAQDDEQEGLDPSSQMYKALVSNPDSSFIHIHRCKFSWIVI